MNCFWLPDLIDSNEEGLNYYDYVEKVYSIFIDYYLNSEKAMFLEKEVNQKRHPEVDGRHHFFYHLTTSDVFNTQSESHRFPSIQRLERIKWPKSIVMNYTCNEDCPCNKILVWRMKEKGEFRIKLLFEDYNYLVVLADRKSHYLYWTAFVIEENHRIKKYKRQYETNEQIFPPKKS